MSNTISLFEVLEGYRLSGYKPTRGKFMDIDTKSCCPLVAAKMGREGEERVGPKYNIEGVDVNYKWGFINGVDGIEADEDESQEYKNGYKDGTEVWKEIIKLVEKGEL